MTAHSSIEATAAQVGQDYSSELIAAAKTLAEAARDPAVFIRVWMGIGECARLGVFDLDTADVAGPTTTAPETAPSQKETNNNDQ